jgi:hypothetical protein
VRNLPLKTTLFQTEWKWVENPNRHPKEAPFQAELRPVSPKKDRTGKFNLPEPPPAASLKALVVLTA